jgi:hypothetical protein
MSRHETSPIAYGQGKVERDGIRFRRPENLVSPAAQIDVSFCSLSLSLGPMGTASFLHLTEVDTERGNPGGWLQRNCAARYFSRIDPALLRIGKHKLCMNRLVACPARGAETSAQSRPRRRVGIYNPRACICLSSSRL